MSAIDRITPILARTVTIIGLLTALMSAMVAIMVSEPRLLAFTILSILTTAYGQAVTQRHRAETNTAISAAAHSGRSLTHSHSG